MASRFSPWKGLPHTPNYLRFRHTLLGKTDIFLYHPLYYLFPVVLIVWWYKGLELLYCWPPPKSHSLAWQPGSGEACIALEFLLALTISTSMYRSPPLPVGNGSLSKYICCWLWLDGFHKDIVPFYRFNSHINSCGEGCNTIAAQMLLSSHPLYLYLLSGDRFWLYTKDAAVLALPFQYPTFAFITLVIAAHNTCLPPLTLPLPKLLPSLQWHLRSDGTFCFDQVKLGVISHWKAAVKTVLPTNLFLWFILTLVFLGPQTAGRLPCGGSAWKYLLGANSSSAEAFQPAHFERWIPDIFNLFLSWFTAWLKSHHQQLPISTVNQFLVMQRMHFSPYVCILHVLLTLLQLQHSRGPSWKTHLL